MECDEQLVRRLIEQVTIFNKKMTVMFKSGAEIVVKMFVPKNHLTSIRLEQIKRKNGNSENIKYYLLTNDFFFLVSKLDFTIYDPYKTSATGRRGYIGLDLPDCEELYAARIEDPLIDAIASKLLEYIQAKKFEQY